MSILSAIRISLYLIIVASILAQPLTLVSGAVAVGCLAMAILIGVIDYYCQVSYNEQKPVIVQNEIRREGMWCRMCGGACDLENCGMEQP